MFRDTLMAVLYLHSRDPPIAHRRACGLSQNGAQLKFVVDLFDGPYIAPVLETTLVGTGSGRCKCWVAWW